MQEKQVNRSVVITNPQGLHARPADLFVKTGLRFTSKIEVLKGQIRVDGKSILDLLTLGATEGTRLEIVASGPDAEEAAAALVEVLNHHFDE